MRSTKLRLLESFMIFALRCILVFLYSEWPLVFFPCILVFLRERPQLRLPRFHQQLRVQHFHLRHSARTPASGCSRKRWASIRCFACTLKSRRSCLAFAVGSFLRHISWQQTTTRITWLPRQFWGVIKYSHIVLAAYLHGPSNQCT